MSFIIPTYNDLRVGITINSIIDSSQKFKNIKYEIIIINDGSTIKFPQIKKEMIDIRYIDYKKNRGPAFARNVGVKNSKYDYCVFLDSDTKINSIWINRALKAIEDDEPGSKVAGYCGEIVYEGSKYFSSVVKTFIKHNSHVGNIVFWCSTANFICKKKAIKEIGGFDKYFFKPGGEDVDLCDKLRKRGWKIYYVPQMVVFHSQVDIYDLIRRAYNYGFGYGRLQSKNISKKYSHSNLYRFIFITLVFTGSLFFMRYCNIIITLIFVLLSFLIYSNFLALYIYRSSLKNFKKLILLCIISFGWDTLFAIGHIRFCCKNKCIKNLFYSIEPSIWG